MPEVPHGQPYLAEMSSGKLADCTVWRCRACGNRFDTAEEFPDTTDAEFQADIRRDAERDRPWGEQQDQVDWLERDLGAEPGEGDWL